MSLVKQLNELQKELHSIHKGDCYTETNYNELKDKIRLLKTDIRHLRLFEMKIKDNKVSGYGKME